MVESKKILTVIDRKLKKMDRICKINKMLKLANIRITSKLMIA
tara:strand:- start:725 stop:853 length:129 start_codon:yes stop_codon:yes gene_type:complete